MNYDRSNDGLADGCRSANRPCSHQQTYPHGVCDHCSGKSEPLDARRDPIIEAVRADLHRRSQLGIRKYGHTLADNPQELRDKLKHAYEEALDLANYLKWAIMELERDGYEA